MKQIILENTHTTKRTNENYKLKTKHHKENERRQELKNSKLTNKHIKLMNRKSLCTESSAVGCPILIYLDQYHSAKPRVATGNECHVVVLRTRL